MACKVERIDGKIANVVTDEGLQSRLYEDISTNLFTGSKEVSLNIFGQSEKDSVKELYLDVTDRRFVYEETLEPRLYYRDKSGEVYDNLSEIALKREGGVVEMGVLNPNNNDFIKFASFDTTSSKESRVLFDLLGKNMISEKRVDVDGDLFVQGEGTNKGERLMNIRAVQEELRDRLFVNTEVNENGYISYRPLESDFHNIKMNNGKVVPLTKDGIKQALRENRVGEQDKVVSVIRAFSDKFLGVVNLDTMSPVKTQEQYVDNLYTFLRKLGFDTVVLDNYREVYKNRHGEDIGVEALMDLGNKVIALSENLEGQALIEAFTEEVVHLAIEAYENENGLSAALLEVADTELYKARAEEYRQKYASQYSDEGGVASPLEVAVRKEILGQLIRDGIVSSEFKTTESRNIFQRFLDYVRSLVRPMHKSAIKSLTEEIQEAFRTGNMVGFKAPLTKNGVFYSLNDNAKLSKVTRTIKEGFKRMRIINELGKDFSDEATPLINSTLYENTLEDLTPINNLSAISQFNNLLNIKLNILEEQIAEGKLRNGSYLTWKHLNTSLRPLIGDFRSYLQDTSNFKGRVNELESAKLLLSELEKLETRMTDFNVKRQEALDEAFDNLIDEIGDSFGFTSEQKASLKAHYDEVGKDINKLSMYAQIPSETSKETSLIIRIADEMNVRIMEDVGETVNPIVNRAEKGDKKFSKTVVQKDANGKDSFYFENPFRMADFNEASLKAKVNIIKKILDDKGVETYKVEDIEKALREGALVSEFLTEMEDQAEFRKRYLLDFQVDNETMRMKKEYYIERERDYEAAEVSLSSREQIENLKTPLRSFMAQFSENGVIDRSLMTEADKLTEQRLIIAEQNMVSPTNGGIYYSGLISKRAIDITQSDLANMPAEFRKLNSQGVNEFLDWLHNERGGNVTLFDGTDKSTLDDNARLALDYANLSLLRGFKNFKEKGTLSNPTDYSLFISKVEQILGTNPTQAEIEQAWDWMMDNGVLGYSETYYNNIELGLNFNKKVEVALSTLESSGVDITGIRSQYEELKQLNILRSEILKKYRDRRDSTEIIATEMTETDKASVLNLDTEISEIRRDIIKTLERYMPEEEEGFEKENVVSELNLAFYEDLRKSGKSFTEFVKAHMSESRFREFSAFEHYVRQVFRENPTTESIESFNRKIQGYIDSGQFEFNPEQPYANEQERQLSQSRDVQRLTELFAKDMIASYYKSVKIEGQQELFEALKRGEIKRGDTGEAITLLDFIKSEEDRLVAEASHPLLKNFKFTPDYTWNSALENEQINEEFIEDFGGAQPIYDVYKSEKFKKDFGFTDAEIKAAGYNVLALEAKTNKERWDYLKALFELKKIGNDFYKENTNIALRPQFSARTFEKVTSKLFRGQAVSSLKDVFRDMTTDRVDEQHYGAYIDGQSAKEMGIITPPKYGNVMLESPEMLTDSHLTGVALRAYEAIRYKHRMDSIESVEAVRNHIENKTYGVGIGIRKNKISTRRGQDSNILQQANTVINHIFYGIKETSKYEVGVFGRSVDLTRVLRTMQNVFSFQNLTLDPMIEAVSVAQGMQTRAIERLSGFYNSKGAWKKGRARGLSASAKFAGQTGKVRVDSEIITLLEGLGLEDFTSRVSESKYSRGGKIFSEGGYLLASIINSPIKIQTMYANLYDTKIVEIDGVQKFVQYQNYESIMKSINPKLTSSEIKSMWETNDNHILKFMDIESGTIKANDNLTAIFGDEATTVLNNALRSVSTKTKQQTQRYDTIIGSNERTLLQLNAATNTLMQHHGWAVINLSRIFKKRFFNSQTGIYEEGTSVTFRTFVGELMKVFSKEQTIAEAWDSLDRFQKGNMRTVGMRAFVITLLGVLAMSLRGADTPDEPWMKRFANYMAHRMYYESKLNSLYGSPNVIYDKVKQPVVMMGNIDGLRRTLNYGLNGEWDEFKDMGARRYVPGYKGALYTANPEIKLGYLKQFNSMSLWEIMEE